MLLILRTSSNRPREALSMLGGSRRAQLYSQSSEWVTDEAVAPRAGRGSKQRLVDAARRGPVAPRAGAWIETVERRADRPRAAKSPPAQGRGSKHSAVVTSLAHRESPPAQGRGSKRAERARRLSPARSPPAQGRGSKPQLQFLYCHRQSGRPSRRGVDRNRRSLIAP